MMLLASLGQISLTVASVAFHTLNYANELDNQMEWSILTSFIIILIYALFGSQFLYCLLGH